MPMLESQQHTYEELREVVIDILLKRETVAFPPTQWAHLSGGVAEVLRRRAGQPVDRRSPPLRGPDAELVRDIFWDLFRQGFITLGLDDMNSGWPFFRLSHFGEKALSSLSPYRFHDTSPFLAVVKKEIPDISSEALAYLDEAVAAFYAGCLLASCVMLGVAAEAEFLRLVDVAIAGRHAARFVSVQNASFIRQKITKFRTELAPLLPSLPKDAREDLEINLDSIQSVLRIARNDAGHPNAAAPNREQVYVLLQLFVPFAKQAMKLRGALA
jgi:hypothetical protein